MVYLYSYGTVILYDATGRQCTGTYFLIMGLCSNCLYKFAVSYRITVKLL